MRVVQDTGTPGKSLLSANLQQRTIPSLDGLRTISVALVILLHDGVPYVPDTHGVLTFFVLSGFLITWLLLKESERTGGVSIKDFYIRRTLRIFPAFYVFWIVAVFFYLLTRGIPGRGVVLDYLAAFFYLGDYRHTARHMQPALGHTWSLGVEEKFYLLWPWIFLVFQRDLRKLTAILVVLIAVIYVYRNILFFGFHVGEGHLHFAFDTRADHLFIGCLLAVLLKRGGWRGFWSAITPRTWGPTVTLALLVGSIALGNRYGYSYKYAMGFSLDAFLIAILLAQVVALGGSWLWGWLNWPVTRYVGIISYPLYLYHQLAAQVTARLLHGYRQRWITPLGVVSAVLLASVSYHVVEKPFLALKSRLNRVEAS